MNPHDPVGISTPTIADPDPGAFPFWDLVTREIEHHVGILEQPNSRDFDAVQIVQGVDRAIIACYLERCRVLSSKMQLAEWLIRPSRTR